MPRACQEGLPAVATKGEEVQVASAMPAFQAPRHANKVQGTLAPRCDGEHTIPVTRERSPGSRTARDPGNPAPAGITANAILAGVTDTNSLRQIPGYEKIMEVARQRNPNRRLTQPEDVARCPRSALLLG